MQAQENVCLRGRARYGLRVRVFVFAGVYAFMCTHTLTPPLLLNPRYFD